MTIKRTRNPDHEQPSFTGIVVWEWEYRNCGCFLFITSGWKSSDDIAEKAANRPTEWNGGYPDFCYVCGNDDAPFIWRGHNSRAVVGPRYRPTTTGSHLDTDVEYPAAYQLHP